MRNTGARGSTPSPPAAGLLAVTAAAPPLLALGGWESSLSATCPSGCKCTLKSVRTMILVFLLISCHYERKGKTLFVVRESMCLQLPLTLVGPSDAQLVSSGSPQNTGSFKLCVLMVCTVVFTLLDFLQLMVGGHLCWCLELLLLMAEPHC